MKVSEAQRRRQIAAIERVRKTHEALRTAIPQARARRAEAVVRARALGVTQRELGEVMGMSIPSVKKIIANGERDAD